MILLSTATIIHIPIKEGWKNCQVISLGNAANLQAW